MKRNPEEKANPDRRKPVADSEEILKRLDAIDLAIKNLDERLSKLEARFIPYPGHVAGQGKKPS